MQSRTKARMAFVIAIGLLLACAILVWMTIINLVESQRLLTHSHQVQELLGTSESAIASAARARLSYVLNGDEAAFSQYQHSLGRIGTVLSDLRKLTSDDATQQKNCERLERSVNDRVKIWETSVAVKRSGLPAPEGQEDMTRQSVASADEIVNVTQTMRNEESRLIQQRTNSLHLHFLYAVVMLVITFTAAVLLLLWHYRLLRAELEARHRAQVYAGAAARNAMEAEHKAHASEQAAIASQDAARRLSARLMQLQDEERRKFSRELHDSIGQYLVAAKMMLQQIAAGHDGDRHYAECVSLIDQSIRETRTISHLLHPPGLDEAGFSSAATWYLQGFAKRSGLDVKMKIANPAKRLPREVEVALFRVLQESLTNIHRHSKSASAEATFEEHADRVVLTIRDHGVGISKEFLERFRALGTSGVGLAGMRERIRELGGTFVVESDGGGTSVRVVVPTQAAAAADLSA